LVTALAGGGSGDTPMAVQFFPFHDLPLVSLPALPSVTPSLLPGGDVGTLLETLQRLLPASNAEVVAPVKTHPLPLGQASGFRLTASGSRGICCVDLQKTRVLVFDAEEEVEDEDGNSDEGDDDGDG
jgi:hypothetical protein